MTTHPTPEPQGFPNNPQTYGIPPEPPAQNVAVLPARYGSNPPQKLPTYDEVTPGEPAQYLVPAEYRRPFGAVPRDKRGKFWTPAFAAVSSGIAAVAVLFTPLAFYGISIVAGIAAIVFGIRALVVIGRCPQTSYSGKAKAYSWLGIGGGALSLLLTLLAIVGVIALFSSVEDETCNMFSPEYDSYLCEMNSSSW